MENKWILSIILTLSTMLFFPYNVELKPGSVNVDVKVHVNGKKVIHESHPKRPDRKRINPIQTSLCIYSINKYLKLI